MKSVSRERVEAFYRAYASRDVAQIEPFIHDDIDWMIAGPVDLLQFCGPRHGKQAVLHYFDKVVPRILRVIRFDPDELLIDGDRTAALGRLSAIQPATGRLISYRLTQFLRFRDNKIIRVRVVMDSFDAAEQVLGHAIDVTQEAGTAPAFAHDRDLVSL